MVNLIRLIAFLLLAYFLYKLFKAFFLASDPKGGNPPERGAIGKGEDLVEDPHCHRYLPLSQAYRTSIDDQDVFFCSKECCEKYLSEKKA